MTFYQRVWHLQSDGHVTSTEPPRLFRSGQVGWSTPVERAVAVPQCHVASRRGHSRLDGDHRRWRRAVPPRPPAVQCCEADPPAPAPARATHRCRRRPDHRPPPAVLRSQTLPPAQSQQVATAGSETPGAATTAAESWPLAAAAVDSCPLPLCRGGGLSRHFLTVCQDRALCTAVRCGHPSAPSLCNTNLFVSGVVSVETWQI